MQLSFCAISTSFKIKITCTCKMGVLFILICSSIKTIVAFNHTNEYICSLCIKALQEAS